MDELQQLVDPSNAIIVVTTLSPKGDSFSRHARRNRPRFVLNAQPERVERTFEDISGSVHIPINF